MQSGTVAAGPQFAKTDASSGEDVEHHVEMAELFLHDVGHRATEISVLDLGEQQIHRHSGRLLFAMGVVDEQFFNVVFDLRQPTVGGRGTET